MKVCQHRFKFQSIDAPPTQSYDEFIAEKRNFFRVNMQASYLTDEMTSMETKIDRKRKTLEASEVSMQKDKDQIENFINANKKIVRVQSAKNKFLLRQLAEKEEKIRELDNDLSKAKSSIQTRREKMLKLRQYREFVLSISNPEHRAKQVDNRNKIKEQVKKKWIERVKDSDYFEDIISDKDMILFFGLNQKNELSEFAEKVASLGSVEGALKAITQMRPNVRSPN